MKKYMIGFVAGALFMVAGQSFAGSTSFLGKKVDSEVAVKVDGQVIDNAIVIQGKSFVPVRNIATAMGGEVSAVGKGGIELTTGIDLSNVDDKAYKLKVLNSVKAPIEQDIINYTNALVELEKNVQRAEADTAYAEKNSPDSYPRYQKTLEEAKAAVQYNNDKIAELQAKIDAINIQIAEVEAQP